MDNDIPPLPPTAPAPPPPPRPAAPYRSLALIAWVLLCFTALASLIPVIGFATWFFAAPIFLATIVLGIITLTRGGTIQGILILVASLVAAPLFILAAPLITTALLGHTTFHSDFRIHRDAAAPADETDAETDNEDAEGDDTGEEKPSVAPSTPAIDPTSAPEEDDDPDEETPDEDPSVAR